MTSYAFLAFSILAVVAPLVMFLAGLAAGETLRTCRNVAVAVFFMVVVGAVVAWVSAPIFAAH